MVWGMTSVLALGLSLSSCGSKSDGSQSNGSQSNVKTHKYKGLYTVSVPEYMSSTRELNEQAGTQFMNASREAYMIIIDEEKDEFVETFRIEGLYDENKSVLENYAEFQRTSFNGVIQNPTKNTPITYSERNGLKMAEAILEGPSVDIPYDIHYLFGFIEGKEYLYFMVCWTLLENHEMNGEDLKNILYSFKEI